MKNMNRTKQPSVLPALLALSLIWLAPIVACGSFAPRPTPTPTPITAAAAVVGGGGGAEATPTPTPLPIIATPTFTPAPTPTFTPIPEPGTVLIVGQPARISAPNGLNLRTSPNTVAELVQRLTPGERVTVLNGPQEAEGFTWWEIENSVGVRGWAAESDGETVWISPRIGEAQPVNRDPKVGDLVQVTTVSGQFLTVRALPGTDAPVQTQVQSGSRFTVIGGPQSANGFVWYQLRADDGSVEGWGAVGDGSTRWLSPLE